MTTLQGTLHFGGEHPTNTLAGGRLELEGGASLADGFHTFALEWEAGQASARGAGEWWLAACMHACMRARGMCVLPSSAAGDQQINDSA